MIHSFKPDNMTEEIQSLKRTTREISKSKKRSKKFIEDIMKVPVRCKNKSMKLD